MDKPSDEVAVIANGRGGRWTAARESFDSMERQPRRITDRRAPIGVAPATGANAEPEKARSWRGDA